MFNLAKGSKMNCAFGYIPGELGVVFGAGQCGAVSCRAGSIYSSSNKHEME